MSKHKSARRPQIAGRPPEQPRQSKLLLPIVTSSFLIVFFLMCTTFLHQTVASTSTLSSSSSSSLSTSSPFQVVVASNGNTNKLSSAKVHLSPSGGNSASAAKKSAQNSDNQKIATSSAAATNSNTLPTSNSTGGQLRNFRPPQQQAQQQQHTHYKTHYACEGNSLDLSCEDRKLIHLVRANYGRFSLSICNEFGHSNLSVQCASFRAFLLMESRCNNLNNCSVVVSKDLFGDPCEGTSKYLEVQYFCHEGDAEKAHESFKALQPQPPPPPPPQQQQPQQVQHPNRAPLLPQRSVIVSGQQQPRRPTATQDFCPPIISTRSMHWNATRAGSVARQNCPDGALGTAQWECFGGEMATAIASDPSSLFQTPSPSLSLSTTTTANWLQSGPDFGDCQSIWLSNLASLRLSPLLAQSLFGTTQAAAIAQRELALSQLLGELAMVAKTRELFAADLRLMVQMLTQIVSQARALNIASPQTQQHDQTSVDAQLDLQLASSVVSQQQQGDIFVELALRQLVEVVSPLLDDGQRNAWLEIGTNEERRQLMLRVQDIVRDLAALVAQQPRRTSSSGAALKNVLAAVLVAPANGGDLRFPTQSTADVMPQTSLASDASFQVLVPEQVLAELAASSEFSAPRLVLVAFKVDSFIVKDFASSVAQQQMQQLDPPAQPNERTIAGLFAVTSATQTPESLDATANVKLNQLLRSHPISISFKTPAASDITDYQQQQQQQQKQQQLASLNQPCMAFDSSDQRLLCYSSQTSGQQQCKCPVFAYYSFASAALAAELPPPSLLPEQPVDNLFAPFGPAAGATKRSQSSSSAPAVGWTLVLGLAFCALFVPAAALLIGASIRASSSKSALDKKNCVGANFFSSTNANRGNQLVTSNGAIEPLVIGGSVLGQPGAAASVVSLDYTSASDYKLHAQSQLYAAGALAPQAQHLTSSHLGAYYSDSSSAHHALADTQPINRGQLTALLDYLRPTRWLSRVRRSAAVPRNVASLGGGGGSVRHSIIASSSPETSNYTKSTPNHSLYAQNGYSAGAINQHIAQHQRQQHQNQPATSSSAASNSSNSYTCTSSAYYEEIGPGNLTKINVNQTTNSRQNQANINQHSKSVASTFARTNYQQHNDNHLNQQQLPNIYKQRTNATDSFNQQHHHQFKNQLNNSFGNHLGNHSHHQQHQTAQYNNNTAQGSNFHHDCT